MSVLPDPYLTVAEVAVWLGLTEKAVRGLVQRDAIPHRKVGKGLRFDRAEVETWSQPTRVRPRSVHAVNVVRGRRKTGDGSLTAELKALGYR
jgi:excisionase family DNA binding protein